METKSTKFNELTKKEVILSVAHLIKGIYSREIFEAKLKHLLEWIVEDAAIEYENDIRDIYMRVQCYRMSSTKDKLEGAKMLYDIIKGQTAL